MRRAIVASVSVAALAYATGAFAAPPQLKGEYAFTGSATCIQAPSPPSGFNPATLTPIADTVTPHSFSVEGIRTFNGDGTGHAELTSVGVTEPPTASGSSEKASFNFTYTVNDDGTFDTHLVPGSFQGTVLQGPRSGQTFTVDKLDLSGLLTNSNKVLTLASVTAEVETLVFSGPPNTIQRICHRSRILSWIGE